MNLHINVIRGCCVLGYFQQRGWEDVKHAKPLCRYANWLHFSIWIPTLLKWTCLPVLCLFFFLNQGPKWACVCVCVFLSRPPGRTAACLHISSVRCGINGLRMLSASDSPVILAFDTVFLWHSKYRGTSGSQAGRRARHTASLCKYQIPKHMPKRLACHKSRGLIMLAIRLAMG